MEICKLSMILVTNCSVMEAFFTASSETSDIRIFNRIPEFCRLGIWNFISSAFSRISRLTFWTRSSSVAASYYFIQKRDVIKVQNYIGLSIRTSQQVQIAHLHLHRFVFQIVPWNGKRQFPKVSL